MALSAGRSNTRNGMAFRFTLFDFNAVISRADFRATQTEDKKLRKDLNLEVPCFEGTLQIAFR